MRTRATPPEPRLAAGVVVAALRRRIEAEGGTATVLAKGDATAGALLLVLAERGDIIGVTERSLAADGYAWRPAGPNDPAERDDYLARRRHRDPDLWIVELDHSEAARIAAEVLG